MAKQEPEDPVLLRFRSMWKPARVVYARPRTFFAMAIGIIAFFVQPDTIRLVTRLLISWDIFITLYLILVYAMVLRSGLSHIRRNAVLQDDGRFLILLVTALGAFPASPRLFPNSAPPIAARRSCRWPR